MNFYNSKSSLLFLIKSLIKNRELIIQLSNKEITSNYRGSFLGLGWSFLNPIIMLSIYTFIFSVIFEAKWGIDTNNKTEFALILFSGIIVHSLFCEILNSSPYLLSSNQNFVKKIVFPLEILPVVKFNASLFNSIISIFILLIGCFISSGNLNWKVAFFPITLFPIIPLTIGTGWLFSSLGVYIKDIGQFTGILTTLLMFLCPIFYPLSAVPIFWQKFMYINPLTLIVQEFRSVIIYSNFPNFKYLALHFLISLFYSIICFSWFQKSRKGFPDTL